MEREKVLTLLRQHQAELEASGIQTASLFGSVARGEPNPGDVDLAVRFHADAPKGWDIFPVLDHLEARLRHILDTEVDILEEPARKPGMQAAIDKDRIVVF
ncbi:MAG: nucleotidyltransferase domain-containing protein [Bryobacteraceae bacterium]|nr:nucleotidyltransferase domain-containing protein [Bryobacteraceae bacterium]